MKVSVEDKVETKANGGYVISWVSYCLLDCASLLYSVAKCIKFYDCDSHRFKNVGNDA